MSKIVWRKFKNKPFGSNTYLVFDRETYEGFIVDPGGFPEGLKHWIEKLSPVNIKFIFVTHGHIDHIRAIKEIKKFTGAKIVIHHAEVEIYRNPLWNLSLFTLRPLIPPQPEILVEDEDMFYIGNMSLRILHTPGHTPGSICLVLDNIVITGDTLFYKSAGATWLPKSSKKTLLYSLKEKILTLEDSFRILPGHGRTALLEKVKKVNPVLLEAALV